MVNPEPTLSIAAGHGFVNANEIGRIEIGFPVAIEEVSKSINKHPPVSFRGRMIGPLSWLSTKPNGQPD
jgi:hypothetical protein